MTETDVVVTGAGPNGLMLACELGLAGVKPVVLESLPEPTQVPKANGLLGQVVPVLDRRGLYERLSGGPGPPTPVPTFMFAAMPLDLSMLDENPVYTLPVPQTQLVRALEERAVELGVELRRGHELVGLSQDRDAVYAQVSGPDGRYVLRSGYLVGADGAHSATRTLSGIAFPGVTYDRTTMRTAQISIQEELLDRATGGLDVPGYGAIPPFIGHRTERGSLSYAPFPGRPALLTTTEWDQPDSGEPMSLLELRESVLRVLGVELPFGPPDGEGPHVLRRRTGGNTRMAERFRDGRVFLTGDAAHVDAAGGQGLNLGIQDAVNLGWKLAAQLRGEAPCWLLDTYHDERAHAARRVTVYAQAIAALGAPGSDVTALRELFGELLGDTATVRRLAELTAGTDVRYDMGGDGAHPLVGRCSPDLTLTTVSGPVRLAELVRSGRPLLVDATQGATLAPTLAQWDERIETVVAQAVAGTAAPTAMLLRPDSYVAWASSSPDPDAGEHAALRAAAERWFG